MESPENLGNNGGEQPEYQNPYDVAPKAPEGDVEPTTEKPADAAQILQESIIEAQKKADEKIAQLKNQLKKMTGHQEDATETKKPPLLDEADNQIGIIDKSVKNELIATSDPNKVIFKQGEIKIEGEVPIPTGPEGKKDEPDKIVTEVEAKKELYAEIHRQDAELEKLHKEMEVLGDKYMQGTVRQEEYDRQVDELNKKTDETYDKLNRFGKQEKVTEPIESDKAITETEKPIDNEDKDSLIEQLKQENADIKSALKAKDEENDSLRGNILGLQSASERSFKELQDQISQLKTELANQNQQFRTEVIKTAIAIIPDVIRALKDNKGQKTEDEITSEVLKGYEEKQRGQQPEKTTTTKTDDKVVEPVFKPAAKEIGKTQEPKAQLPVGDESLEEAWLKEVTAEKESERWWDSLSKEEKEVVMKSYRQGPEYTGDLRTSFPKKYPKTEYLKEQKLEKTTKVGGVRIPTFDPKEFFKVPTTEDFNPNKPFEETETGTQTKSQLVHATYRKGYRPRLIPGEQAKMIEDTIEDFQNEEKRVLAEYYEKLVEAAEANGLDIDDSATAKMIRENMVTAKRSLERHLVNNYGKKVNQERRSNWWLRFVNFLNSDIYARKTIGKAMDIVAMNGGNLENAYAAIKNMVKEDENGEKNNYSKIIGCMNAHLRRAIKKSLDTSITKNRDEQVGFYSPDDPRYDRYETYRILQKVYCEGMADKIKAAQEETERPISVDEMLDRILSLQKERLMTMEENVGTKKWRDAWNKLKAATLGGVIGGIIIALLSSGYSDKKMENNKVWAQEVKHRTPIEQVETKKVDQKTIEEVGQATVAPETADEGLQSQGSNNPEIIYETKIGDKKHTVKINKTTGDFAEVDSDTSKLDDGHEAASKIQVTATEHGKEINKLFISDTASIEDLKDFRTKFNALSETDKAKMDQYIHKSPDYGVLGAELGGASQRVIDWVSHRIAELEEKI